MTRIPIGLIVTLLSTAVAAPLWAQGNYTAASCNYSDVKAVINGPIHVAVNGDTIHVPSGTCTWTSGITVSSGVGITIKGSGIPNSTPSTTGAASTCTATVIIDNATSSPPPLFLFQPTSASSLSRLSCLKLQAQSGLGTNTLYSPVAAQGVCNSTTCPNVRIDNLTFDGNFQTLILNSDTVIVTDNIFGVIDHNSMSGIYGKTQLEFVNYNNSSWNGVGAYGDNSWASPDTFGTLQALYIENNLLGTAVELGETEAHVPNFGAGGGRAVARFNNCNGCLTLIVNHGTESDGRSRGGRQMESYGNTYQCTNTSGGCGGGAELRSGVAIEFGNSLTAISGSWVNQYLSFSDYRTLNHFAPWGGCDGTSPYDTNDGGATPTVYATGRMGSVSNSGITSTFTATTCSGSICTPWTTNQLIPTGSPYAVHDTTTGAGVQITSNTSNTITATGWSTYPNFNNGDTYQIRRATVCVDQPNRGRGTLLSGATPSPVAAVNESLDPSYEWDDSGYNPNFGNVSSSVGDLHLIANRDWYTDNSHGRPQAQTSPSSPFNGTIGVGFGTLANRPTTCMPAVGYFATDQGNWNHSGNGFGQGELFVCTATNTWTLAYTPYIYPHPLTQPGGPPSPPSKLAATSQ